MKPAGFRYLRPTTVAEAVDALAEGGGDARPLAGGQSLVPAMNFRLSTPSVLVDLNRIEELAFVRVEDGELRIGAMTRQRAAETSPEVAATAPLLVEALGWVGHPQIRNRGTVGGSLAHADPAAELPAVLLALDGRCRLVGPDGERWVEAVDFYTGLFGTACGEAELLVETALPVAREGEGGAFEEAARRHGDFALAGVAAWIRLDARGRCAEARLGLVGLGPCPVRAEEAAELLTGEAPTADAVAEAARVLSEEVDPPDDVHATPAYRRRLARALGRRALERAAGPGAGGGAPGGGGGGPPGRCPS